MSNSARWMLWTQVLCFPPPLGCADPRETQGKVTVCVYSHRAGVGRPLQRGFKSCFWNLPPRELKASCCCFLAGKPWAQCCVSKCVAADSGSGHRAKPWFVKCADFWGVNTLPMADFKLLRWSHWAHSLAEPCAPSSLQQAGAKQLTTLGAQGLSEVNLSMHTLPTFISLSKILFFYFKKIIYF